MYIRLTNMKHVLCFYLNNKVFLSRNYCLIIALRKFDVLKTNICPPLNVPPRTISKMILNYFQLLRWKPWKANVKFLKRKQQKPFVIQSQQFIYKPACLQIYFHGRVLSIRVFSSDGHYINNSLHFSTNICWDICRGHYLFWEANSFPRTQLEENCELRGTGNVQGQISEHISAPNGGYCAYYSSNLFRNARGLENWGIFNN